MSLTKEASRSCFNVVRAVGLKVLKNKLSEYVRLAASGETISPASGQGPEAAAGAVVGVDR